VALMTSGDPSAMRLYSASSAAVGGGAPEAGV